MPLLEIGTFKEHREHRDYTLAAVPDLPGWEPTCNTSEEIVRGKAVYMRRGQPSTTRISSNRPHSRLHFSRLTDNYLLLRRLDKLANLPKASKARFWVLNHGRLSGVPGNDGPRPTVDPSTYWSNVS